MMTLMSSGCRSSACAKFSGRSRRVTSRPSHVRSARARASPALYQCRFVPAARLERSGESRSVVPTSALDLSEALNDKFPVSMQEDIHGLLLGFQPQAAAALTRGRYAEIGDISTCFHGGNVAELPEGINCKPSFVTYTPLRNTIINRPNNRKIRGL